MANILTTTEAANVLRCEVTDVEMLALLPLVDAHLKNATGRDWSADSPVEATAKAAARMLLVMWHENPAMIGSSQVLNFGLTAALVQLEALALQLETVGVPDEALELSASMPADGQEYISNGVVLILIFNHALADDAGSHVTLKDDSGAVISTTQGLDATRHILSMTPTEDLAADTDYFIVLSAIADCFGQTLRKTLSFRTAT